MGEAGRPWLARFPGLLIEEWRLGIHGAGERGDQSQEKKEWQESESTHSRTSHGCSPSRSRMADLLSGDDQERPVQPIGQDRLSHRGDIASAADAPGRRDTTCVTPASRSVAATWGAVRSHRRVMPCELPAPVPV